MTFYGNTLYEGRTRVSPLWDVEADTHQTWTTYTYYKLETSLENADIAFSLRDGFVVAKHWTVDYFKYMYASVGRQHSWWYMLYKSREYLEDQYLNDPKSSYVTLMHAGQPAGFSIVTDEGNGRSNLAYIGLLPEFRSMGLGKRFLNDCLVYASRQSSRMWVYTTSLDHPRALPMYRAAGFSEIERKQMSEYFPTSVLNRE